MKPKTKIQKEVARLSANLRPISATQIDWAYRHCVEHIGYRTKKGNITCSDCGHEWHSDSGLCDTLEGCTCPKCHAELKVQDTRRRIYKETQNFSVITTCKGYQVIRVAQVRCESRKGEPMRFYCHEVVQRWISPDGKVTDMALLRGFLFCYCDVWALGSDMEVRPHNSLYDDVVARSCAYPKMRILPQLRRNGFKGDFHGISPVRLFKALLSDPRIETLMKGGEIEVMKHFLFNTRTADECWASYLIAKRHKYQIDNLSMWCDYLWKDLDIDIVLECTGAFRDKEGAMQHIEAGAKKVLISAPGKDVDATVVYGVNQNVLKASDVVVSNASCTTNCMCPFVKPLMDKLGIVDGMMTTIHAFTNDQVLTDVKHKDLRRARAAADNIIPTKTGAAKAVGVVIPELKGKLDGYAMRVPTLNVSVADLTFNAKRPTTVEEVNKIILEASESPELKGILGYNELPLVSSDFNHTSFSSIFDATLTKVIDGTLVKAVAWYDNEWGFSCRMLDTAVAMYNAK